MNNHFSVYLRELLSNDDALKKFLADPITSSEAAKLTKAERSVLRRALAGASTVSTNGYAIVRPLAGYRQAVAMVYNVMRNQAISMISATTSPGVNIAVSWGPDPSEPGNYPFRNIALWHSPQTTPVTIATAMDAVRNQNSIYSSTNTNFPLVYKDDPQFLSMHPPKRIISSFDIHGETYNAPPQDRNTSTAPFWFWSINGYPNPNDSGTLGESYAAPTAILHPGDCVYWDCIAPGPQYGFKSCVKSDGAHTMGLA